MRNHEALHRFLVDRETAPFAWDLHDCCIGFGAAAVKVQTGIDILEGVRPFKTMRGAAAELARRGGWFEALSSRLTEVPPAFAKRGDLALVDSPGLSAVLVVEGETLVGVGESGLIRLPRSAMVAAWSADG